MQQDYRIQSHLEINKCGTHDSTKAKKTLTKQIKNLQNELIK